MAPARSRPSPASKPSRSPRLEPVGNYAIRIVFDDGHDTGLFSWDYLHELGRGYRTKWAAYLRATGRTV